MVYKGTLHQIGRGEEVRGGEIIVQRIGGFRRREQSVMFKGWIRRSFIRIGDAEIRNVVVRPLWDEYLEEAIGQEIELSIGAPYGKVDVRHPVAALRTPRAGLVKPTTAWLAGNVFQAVIFGLLAAMLFGAIATFVAIFAFGLIFKLLTGSVDTGLVIGLVAGPLLILFLYFKSLRSSYKLVRHSTALN